MMTKKYFISLANAIRGHNRSVGNTLQLFNPSHLDALADFCASQNPAFNRERWMRYVNGECGPNGGCIKQIDPR